MSSCHKFLERLSQEWSDEKHQDVLDAVAAVDVAVVASPWRIPSEMRTELILPRELEILGGGGRQN